MIYNFILILTIFNEVYQEKKSSQRAMKHASSQKHLARINFTLVPLLPSTVIGNNPVDVNQFPVVQYDLSLDYSHTKP